MTQANHTARLNLNPEDNQYYCQGSWSVTDLSTLPSDFRKVQSLQNQDVVISGEQLQFFDSAAALALNNLIQGLEKNGNKVKLVHFSPDQKNLLELIASKGEITNYQPSLPPSRPILERIGAGTVHKIGQVTGLLNLIGDLCVTLFESFGQWRKFRWPSIVSNIDFSGLKALPILALLSFLVGVVLAYQMGLQLKTYGANTFIAYLSGMAIFREFGPLITAIIVAGRTSSSYTAQIGSMKVNEEIDALETMGLSPTELLVMPKVIALVLVFPLMIFWSDAFNIAGAMVMSKGQLGIEYSDYLYRLRESVGLKHMMLGLYKAPAFALIVAMVGCFQGFSVKANAESIGHQTTKSVVQALFLIIITDAIYSVSYSWMGL